MIHLQQGFMTVATAVSAIVLNALWQDALLVLCVWLLLRAWPKINAATRYVVWSATLAAALIVPIATTLPFFTPSQTVSTARWNTLPATRNTLPATPLKRVESTAAVRPQTHPALARSASPATSTQEARLPERARITIPVAVALGVFALWLLLSVLAIVRLTIGLLRLEQLKRDALPLPVEYRDSMPQWLRANKGARDVRLCVSDETDVPVAVGLFDAMILIPHSLLERLSEPEVDQICLHELAHLRRADDWTNGLQRVVSALLGWNPAAQFIGQQLDLEREVACDDWVLSFVGTVRPYALCLTKMAETALWPRHPIPAPGVFATRKHISLRIERLLGAGRNIATNLSLAPAAAAVAVVGAIALVIAVVAPSVAAPVLAAPQIAATAAKSASKAAPATAASLAPAAASTEAPVTKSATPLKPTEKIVTRYIRVAQATPPEPRPTRVHVEVPATHVHVPAIHVDVPGTTVDVPGMNFDIAVPDGKAISEQVRASINSSMHGLHSVHVAQGNACADCDYSGVNWAGRDLRGVRYSGVDFSKANLSGSNLSGSTIVAVDFSGANLSGVSFRNARISKCDFSNANLSGADFTGASISGCDFERAKLNAAAVRDVLNGCKACDFNHADLSGVDLHGLHIATVDFSGADLRGVNLAGAQIVATDFSDAKLDGANLNGATLTECDLGGVDLTHVDLSKAKLINTDVER